MSNSASPYAYLQEAARPWRQADAQRWAEARPAAWVRPVWSAVLLVAAVVAAIAQSPDCACTAQAPCGEQWLDAAGTMLFLPYLLSLFVLPELAVVTAPLLLLYMTRPGQWAGGANEKVADVAVVLALCWGCGAGAARLSARRRQRALVLQAAGGVSGAAPAPAGISPSQRGLIRLVLAVLMWAASAGLIGSVVADDRAIDRTAQVAAVRDVPVVAYDADASTLTVRLPDGRRHTFDVNGTYTRGSTVRVLVHGAWVQLASEPYGDHFVRQALGLGLAGLGLVTGGSGLLARRRTMGLYRGPVPVLNVRARTDSGHTTVFAFDDDAGRRPVLHYDASQTTTAPMVPATVYGAVTEGGKLVLAGPPGPHGTHHVELSLSALRLGGREASAGAPVSPRGEFPAPRRDADHDRAAEIRADQAAAHMSPTTTPVRWTAGPAARCLGTAISLAGISLAGAAIAGLRTGWWTPLQMSGFCLLWLNGVRPLLTWQITADAEGLHTRTLWSRPRHIPWAQLTAAAYTARGELILEQEDPLPRVSMGVVGSPFVDRRLNRPGRATRAAADITAMIRHPHLRPTATPQVRARRRLF